MSRDPHRVQAPRWGACENAKEFIDTTYSPWRPSLLKKKKLNRQGRLFAFGSIRAGANLLS